MLLNCGVGEDSWESLGLQGDPTSPFWRRSVLGVLWKNWCWSWNSNTLATSCEELTYWKRLMLGGIGGRRRRGSQDETAGWHHWLDGHESEWTLGVVDGQGGLACCDSWGRKELDMTEWQNWTELKMHVACAIFHFLNENDWYNQLEFISQEYFHQPKLWWDLFEELSLSFNELRPLDIREYKKWQCWGL